MSDDQTTFHDPDDDGAEEALHDAEEIIEHAADGESLEEDEAGAESALAEAEAKAAEHLADLQRLQAEFVNYRKRVDRDKALLTDQATQRVIEALMPALDDIAGAREHGDLEGSPFAAISDKLEESLRRFGWSTFGAAGEEFDPNLHEALMSQPSADVSVPTIQQVAQPGHRIGERVVRAARVIVAQPED